MKLFGHPIHLMLIHFPSALFPMDLICAFLAFYTGNASFSDASFYAITGGVFFGWAAVLAGMFDLAKIASSKKQSLVKKTLIHGGVNTTVLIIYTLFFMVGFKKYPHLVKDDMLILMVKAGAVTLMVIGNFIGGSLVLKDKVVD